jgi:hypothetical protein
LVRLVAIPNLDPLKADDGGLVVLRQRHIDAAFTVDAAAETDFVARVFCDNMAARAAGVEIAGAVTVLNSNSE